MGYTPAGYAQTGGSYTFHFPDGNASIARLLVRALDPAACSAAMTPRTSSPPRPTTASWMRLGANVRMRLNQIVVRARNVPSGVEIAYTRRPAAAR